LFFSNLDIVLRQQGFQSQLPMRFPNKLNLAYRHILIHLPTHQTIVTHSQSALTRPFYKAPPPRVAGRRIRVSPSSSNQPATVTQHKALAAASRRRMAANTTNSHPFPEAPGNSSRKTGRSAATQSGARVPHVGETSSRLPTKPRGNVRKTRCRFAAWGEAYVFTGENSSFCPPAEKESRSAAAAHAPAGWVRTNCRGDSQRNPAAYVIPAFTSQSEEGAPVPPSSRGQDLTRAAPSHEAITAIHRH